MGDVYPICVNITIDISGKKGDKYNILGNIPLSDYMRYDVQYWDITAIKIHIVQII